MSTSFKRNQEGKENIAERMIFQRALIKTFMMKKQNPKNSA